jgi:biopolymer transport protein ExbB/TolQ/DNA-directed RNA polymerase subunit RPC12/RpoP
VKFKCPSCSTTLQTEDDLAGKTVRCPGCNSKVQVPDAPEGAASADNWADDSAPAPEPLEEGSFQPPQRIHRTGWAEADPANANPWLAMLIGAVGTAAWYGIVFALGKGRIYELFAMRGWVNYTETFVFFWALSILYLKWEKLRKQKRAFFLDVVPQDISPEINASTVTYFVDHLYELPARLRDSLIVNRLRKALQLFEVRQDTTEVTSLMGAQSEIDSARIAGSYALVKVFLWAIPILGFIGTVLGLSQALGALDIKDPTDPNAIKAAMSAVTNGMGTSFDTTLLGLVLAMFLNFPIAALSKMEDDNLTDVDAFCYEELLPRLNDQAATGMGKSLADGDTTAFVQALTRSVSDSQKEFLTDLRMLTRHVEEQAANLDKRAAAHADFVQNEFSKTMVKLRSEVSESVTASSDKAAEYVRTLASALQGLNGVLKDLGEKQVLIQQVKRGWFGR